MMPPVVDPMASLRCSRRVPIPSLQMNVGFDYVFFMQAYRIQRMREKRIALDYYFRAIPGLGYISRRNKIKSRQNVAHKRQRDEFGRFKPLPCDMASESGVSQPEKKIEVVGFKSKRIKKTSKK